MASNMCKDKREKNIKILLDSNLVYPVCIIQKNKGCLVCIVGNKKFSIKISKDDMDMIYSNVDYIYDILRQVLQIRGSECVNNNVGEAVYCYSGDHVIYIINKNKEIFIGKNKDIYRCICNTGYKFDNPNSFVENVNILPTFFSVDITYSCNMNCIYCSKRIVNNNYNKKLDRVVSYDVLEKIANFINLLNNKYKLKEVTIQPFGGEPLLYPRKIFWLYDYLYRKNENVKMVVQTNGSLIDTKTARGLYKRSVGVGISIDGPPSIHNTHRRFIHSRTNNSLEVTLEGLSNLCGVGYTLDDIGSITVFSRKFLSDYRNILDYLVGHIGFTKITLNPAITKNSVITPSPIEASEFLIKSFKYIISEYYLQEDVLVEISPITDVLTNLLLGRSDSVCYNLDGCYGGLAMLAFDVDGKVYPCPDVTGFSEYMLLDHPPYSIFDLNEIKNKVLEIRRIAGSEYILGKGFFCFFERSIVGSKYTENLYKSLSVNLLKELLSNKYIIQYLEDILNKKY